MKHSIEQVIKHLNHEQAYLLKHCYNAIFISTRKILKDGLLLEVKQQIYV